MSPVLIHLGWLALFLSVAFTGVIWCVRREEAEERAARRPPCRLRLLQGGCDDITPPGPGHPASRELARRGDHSA